MGLRFAFQVRLVQLRGEDEAACLNLKPGQGLKHDLLAAGGRNPTMELHVGLCHSEEVAAGGSFLQHSIALVDPRQVLASQLARFHTKPGSVRFQNRPQAEDLKGLLPGEARHERPPIREDVSEAKLGEVAECLTDGSSRRVELMCERDLREVLSWAEVPSKNGLPDRGSDVVNS